MEREKKISNLLNKKLNQQLNEEKAIILKHEASLNEILANKEREFRKLSNKVNKHYPRSTLSLEHWRTFKLMNITPLKEMLEVKTSRLPF